MNIIFIGGIHGVGKGTICSKVCHQLKLHHLCASDILNWDEISERENKLVRDFTFTQNRLTTNLKRIVNEDEKYVLDGHFCLLNTFHEPERIDFATFELLNPFAFIVVVDEIQTINKRLKTRDKKEYDLGLLSRFQDLEIEYSIEISNKLKKPHLILRNQEVHKLKTFLSYENFA